ncbi:TIGR02391 family protein [Candidatus Pacearchaeota archaeon]|nr:TIGR02391 family protein [Candidatus Pacearchaeota archaeon]
MKQISPNELEDYINRKGDIERLSFVEQIKYFCYFYTKINSKESFYPKEIESLFKEASLKVPSNINAFLNVLQKRNIVIKFDGEYRLHRSVIKELDLEFAEAELEKQEPKNPIYNVFEILEIHPKIREVSEERFYKKDYSVAIEKSFKRIIKLVQERSGKTIDGTPLMETVFSQKNPILKFNELKSPSDINEQKGMMDLYRGSVECIRNVRFHEEIEEDEEIMTLHLLIFASFLAKKLDETMKNDTKNTD